MANPIPPLLCSTPPPIDFENEENDDDFGDFEVETNGQFEGPATPKHKSLDLPLPNDINLTIVPPTIDSPQIECVGVGEMKKAEPLRSDDINEKSDSPANDQCPSPPSLDLDSNVSLSPSDSSSDEHEFKIDEIRNVEASAYDDNTSLPSLKFDLSDEGKTSVTTSTTPPAEQKLENEFIKCVQSNEIESSGDVSALESESVAKESDKHPNDLGELETHAEEQKLEASLSQSLSEEAVKIDGELTEDQSQENHFKNSEKEAPKVEIYDDDDDFNDFEGFSAAPAISDQAPESENASKPVEFAFEADFSQFAAFESAPEPVPNVAEALPKESAPIVSSLDDLDEDDFEDFRTATVVSDHVQCQEVQKSVPDDDDDFGEFNDFQESAGHSSDALQLPSIASLNEKLKPILEMMFPSDELDTRSEQEESEKFENLKTTLNQVDSAVALEYQFNNSNVRHSLIRSLGIDSRNILYGEKWNSSMPRFAANLSFSPLQPLKPTTSTSNTTPSALPNSEKQAEPPAVPAVEFDWGTAGLVNPLDGGVKEIVCEGKAETVHAPKSGELNDESVDQQSSHPVEQEAIIPNAIASAETTAPDAAAPNTNLTTDLGDNFEPIAKPDEPPLHSAVVTTSTFAGPLKETHIYTPAKSENNSAPKSTTKILKNDVDFDFATAAAGIIIDETVVKKEYRDVEYNPKFDSEGIMEKMEPSAEIISSVLDDTPTSKVPAEVIEDDDDFTEFADFQSVEPSAPQPPPVTVAAPPTEVKTSPNHWPKLKGNDQSKSKSRTGTPASFSDEMILSPAILLPQAIQMERAPKIEWPEPGINPEELARFDELFSQSKASPSHVPAASQNTNSLSISQTIANQSQFIANDNDDDDWSDFVSMPVPSTTGITHRLPPSPSLSQRSPKKQQQKLSPRSLPSANNSANDDEWSDFVSSAPLPSKVPPPASIPYQQQHQFNSAAWQNANFYNNPLSVYSNHQGSAYQQHPPTRTSAKSHGNVNNNNNNLNYNNSRTLNQYLANNSQIHMMQDFSAATTSHNVRTNPQNELPVPHSRSNKIAPSISLIPDLGFVAPPQHHISNFVSLPRVNNNSNNTNYHLSKK